MTRYNLTIAFAELDTPDDAHVRDSANAMGDSARTIEQLITTDTALQAVRTTQHLMRSISSPARTEVEGVLHMNSHE